MLCQLWVKPRNWFLINCRYNGAFYHHFCTQNGSRFLPLAPSESGRYLKRTVAWINLLALLSAYQEYLVLNWRRHKLYKEHDQIYTHICVVSAHPCDANAIASANASDVHTQNANARNVRYAGAVKLFFQDGGQVTLACLLLYLQLRRVRFTRDTNARNGIFFIPCVCICVTLVSHVFFLAFAFASYIALAFARWNFFVFQLENNNANATAIRRQMNAIN